MTPKERAAMQQALEALEDELEAETCEEFQDAAEKCHDAITALREALEQPPCPNGCDTSKGRCADCPDPVIEQPDDLDWITPEAVFAAKLKLHGIDNPAEQPVSQEPFGWYFMDDPKVFAMPGSGFHIGKEPPMDCLSATPLYTAPQPVSKEPKYFGLTHDHTWLSIDKKQYDKLKPEGRMACYAAPVRTKDLTDDEAQKLWHDTSSIVPMWAHHLHFARAVIAADREKNK